MALSACCEMNTCEPSVDSAIQVRDVDLREMNVDRAGSKRASDCCSINHRQT